MNNDLKIKFSRWEDPFGSNRDSFGISDEDFEDMSYDDDGSNHMNNERVPVKIVCTHNGMMPIAEHSMAGDIFHFWNINTNFDLTESIIQIIEESEGVETIFPLTRYKMRIGIPRSGLFDEQDVQNRIERNVRKHFECSDEILFISQALGTNPDVVSNIQSKIRNLRKSYSYWAILVMPNAEIETLKSNIINDSFYQKLNNMKNVENLVGGKVFSFMD